MGILLAVCRRGSKLVGQDIALLPVLSRKRVGNFVTVQNVSASIWAGVFSLNVVLNKEIEEKYIIPIKVDQIVSELSQKCLNFAKKSHM